MYWGRRGEREWERVERGVEGVRQWRWIGEGKALTIGEEGEVKVWQVEEEEAGGRR